MKKWKWTDENTARLAKLLADDMTASEIAVELGVMSRNAVIGKVHRMGWSFTRGTGRRLPAEPRALSAAVVKVRPKCVARKKGAAKSSRGIMPAGGLPKDPLARREVFCAIAEHANERFEAKAAAVAEVGAEGVLFLERGQFQCAMPLPGWDDVPVTAKRCCGRPVQHPTSYCPSCAAIVYAPAGFQAFKERAMGETP